MKSIPRDVEMLDSYTRQLWGQNSRAEDMKQGDISTYYASTSSYNWYGFLERINECVESPTWTQVKNFVEYYCKTLGVESSSYLLLYSNLERMDYSSRFKTSMMKSLYLNSPCLDSELDPFYRTIINFFNHYPDKYKI